MSPQPISLQTLERSSSICRNLLYHRTMILEPIRYMAFRNMKHLSNVMPHHPKPVTADIGSPESYLWIELIQDEMLQDQGIDSSAPNRWLLQLATFTPVKLYEALLYAEIEYLEKWRAEYPLSSNDNLNHFLHSQGDFTERSKQFRDGILHPNEQSIPSEQACLLSGSFNELPQLQRTIDTIVSEVQQTLRLELQRFLMTLPELQRWHCNRNFLLWLSNDDSTFHDDELPAQMLQGMEILNKEHPRISREADSVLPTAYQLETNERVLRCMTNLHSPGTVGGPDEENALQPKVDPRFLKHLEFALNPANGAAQGRHFNQVVRNLPSYIFLLNAVGVLLNETMDRIPLSSVTTNNDDTSDYIRTAMEELTLYQRQSLAGLAKANMALLQGLVQASRTYAVRIQKWRTHTSTLLLPART